MSAELRDLRGDIRHWRRGRADARLADVLGDAYVALFATLMLGSMLVNVVVNVRRSADSACTASGCLEARTLLPWIVGAAAVALVLAAARLFGPVFVPPAVDSWLLTTPVDRAPVLRPRLLGAAGIALLVGGLTAAGAATLGGFDPTPLLGFVGAVAVLAVTVVGLAALAQGRADPVARGGLWLLTAALWAGLLVLALDAGPVAAPPGPSTWWTVAPAAGALLAAAALVVALRRLGGLTRRDLAAGGRLSPGLSGALAGLDLALVYDVLLAHRWHRHESVRSRRGGPAGPAALVWCDLTRVRRSPQLLVLLAAGVVVPYAAATAGTGRVVALVAALVGFVAALPLLAGLRVMVRTPGIGRSLPFPPSTARLTGLAVPAVALALFGLATAGAVQRGLAVAWPDAVVLSLAIGGSALAAATRWVTGRPPDYSRPLVSTPAGGVPTNLYGSVVRGFDVLLVTTAPLLIAPTFNGAVFSFVLSGAVLSFLVGRE